MNKKEFYQKYLREIWMTVVTFIYFLPYILINRYSDGRTQTDFYGIIEQNIPVIPISIIVYVSCFILVFLPYFFVKDKKKFLNMAGSYLLVLVIAYTVFLIFPVKAVRPEIIGTTFFQQAMNLMYVLDGPYNMFPSLHVALSFLAAFWINSEKNKFGKIAILWAILISLSTLTTKQHTSADILGGLAVSLLAYALFTKIKRKDESQSTTRIIDSGQRSN